MSVSISPERRLRHRCSSGYLRISPLHPEFPSPLLYSSPVVSNAIPRLSRELSHPTHRTACGPFTPSKSEQHLPPLYYRGCWHRVSRLFSEVLSNRERIKFPALTPSGQEFTTRRPSSSTRRRMFILSYIDNDSRLQPPVGVWAVSQSQCGRSPSQVGYP